jgi:hypothetical protein
VPPSTSFSVSSKFHGNYRNKGISDLCGLVAVQCKAQGLTPSEGYSRGLECRCVLHRHTSPNVGVLPRDDKLLTIMVSRFV